jgi:hypothetical protein
MHQPQLDRVSEWATSDAFREELARARKDFFARTGGEVFEDDKSVDSRLATFLDWYLFDRPLEGRGMPPVVAFLEDHRAELSPEDRAVHEALTRSIHGIFEIRRVAKKERLRLRDLCTLQEYEVSERRQMAGLEKKDLFEARLIPNGDDLLFSQAFCHHPREVRKAILSEVKRRRKLGPIEVEPFIHQLSAMELKYERYRNVPIESIYAFERPKTKRAAPAQ